MMTYIPFIAAVVAGVLAAVAAGYCLIGAIGMSWYSPGESRQVSLIAVALGVVAVGLLGFSGRLIP